MYLLSIHKLFDHWSNTFCRAMISPLFEPEVFRIEIYKKLFYNVDASYIAYPPPIAFHLVVGNLVEKNVIEFL